MALMEWSGDLSVGVEKIDAQHKMLIHMINGLNEAMGMGKGKEVMGKIIEGLVSYAQAHFSLEEALFEKTAYPGAVPHKLEHSSFVEKISGFRDAFNSGKVGVSLEVMNFLCYWLKDHINGIDKKYTSHFNALGIR